MIGEISMMYIPFAWLFNFFWHGRRSCQVYYQVLLSTSRLYTEYVRSVDVFWEIDHCGTLQ